jgi:hypothetical protein
MFWQVELKEPRLVGSRLRVMALGLGLVMVLQLLMDKETTGFTERERSEGDSVALTELCVAKLRKVIDKTVIASKAKQSSDK